MQQPFGFRAALAILRFWRAVWRFHRGKGLAVRAVNALARFGIVQPSWHSVDGHFYWVDLTELICRSVALDGEFDAAVRQHVLANLPPGGTFVDVGANVGVISLAAARHVGEAGTVVAIEPNPEVTAILKKNIACNQARNITVIRSACSNAPGIATLFLSSARNCGKSSLSRENAGTARSVRITCERLDRIVTGFDPERVDVVKIDVEGAELQVLQGMERVLAEYRPVLVLEAVPELLAEFGASVGDIGEFLHARGYRPERIDSTNLLFRYAGVESPRAPQHAHGRELIVT